MFSMDPFSMERSNLTAPDEVQSNADLLSPHPAPLFPAEKHSVKTLSEFCLMLLSNTAMKKQNTPSGTD
ncbi:hypothetical protein ED28_02010 [[Pantoea] beijingensis]|uniref:Uncharacterized protein n=1 Tax=[Pantoea] beijingensis TaxID=1324864 RepID=A0A443II07_9GAMM|nr:hypothetical protein ED28_02010 [[Pantoea] beijingensis]